MTPVDPHFLAGDSDDYRGETPCSSCGYDLRGLQVGSTCPECGAEPVQEEEDEPRQFIDPRFPTTSDEPPVAGSGSRATRTPERHLCASCGYDLKGLGSIGRCPECGLDYDTKRERAAAAASLLPASVAASPRWRLGLLCLLAAASGYIGFALVGLLPSFLPIYELGTLLSLAAWSFGCWLAFPSTLDAGSPTWKWLRISACAVQPLWISAYLLAWLATSLATGKGQVIYLAGMLNLIALAGLVTILVLMNRIAADLYLRDTARLLGNMIWIVIPVALLDWWFPYPAPGGEALFASNLGVFGTVIIFIVLLPLFIIPLVILLASVQLLNFSMWASRYSRQRAGREDRIQAKKAAMSQERDPESPGFTCSTCGKALLSGTCSDCNPPRGAEDDIPLS